MGADMKTQLLNDIHKLSLEKYISEIVGSVMEGMLKCKTSVDVTACVEVYMTPTFFFSLNVIFYRLYPLYINGFQIILLYYYQAN